MHTVEILEESVAVAKSVGYAIREEWLGGGGGGGCEINGQKWLFLDLALDPGEQLGQVLDALRGEPIPATLRMSPTLRALLQARRVA